MLANPTSPTIDKHLIGRPAEEFINLFNRKPDEIRKSGDARFVCFNGKEQTILANESQSCIVIYNGKNIITTLQKTVKLSSDTTSNIITQECEKIYRKLVRSVPELVSAPENKESDGDFLRNYTSPEQTSFYIRGCSNNDKKSTLIMLVIM